MKQKIHYLFMLLLMLVTGVGGVKAQVSWVETSATELKTGDVVVIVDKTSARAMSNDKGTSSAPTATKVTFNTDKSVISSEVATTVQWVVTVDEGSYKFNVPNSENYLYCTNTNNGVRVGSGANYFFDIDGNYLTISVSNTSGGRTTRYVGVYNDQDWRCYENTTGNIKYTVTAFYKKVESGSSAVATTTTIDASDITNTDVYTSTAAGKLTATVAADGTVIEDATVTWSSSNQGVATIAADGTVTLVAAGATTITASYAGVSGEYQASSATYEMTVTSSAPYVQPTTIEANLNNDFFNCKAFTSWSDSYGTTFSGNKDNVTITLAKGESKYMYINTGAIRMYDGNTLTFTAPQGYNITKIVLAGADGFDANLTAEGLSNGTWTGEASEVVIAGNSNKKNITAATITLAKQSSVKVPVFSIPSGTYYGPQTVELTCETEDATIQYSTDGETWSNYTSAIAISETTTLYSKAVKGNDESAVVSATYTIPTTYTTIAAFKDAKTSACLNLTGAQVVYIDEAKKNIYVRDASAAICLYNRSGFTFEEGKELKAGDILSGTIYGKYALYNNNLPEITDIQNFDKLTVTDNTDVTPKAVASKEEIEANMCDLVKIAKTQITETDSKFYVLDVQLYDKLKLGYTPEIGVDASITGVVTDFNKTTEIFPRTLDDIAYYPAAPTFSPEAGTFTAAQDVTISTTTDGAEIYYTTDGSEPTTSSSKYSAAIPVNSSTTIKAIAVKNELSSSVAEATYTIEIPEPVVEPGTPAAITAGFYTIKNLGNGKFVNVAGRKTATLVDNAEGMAGTVIQVESDADGIVKTLRSQGVDVPGYATRAMKYVPDVVKLVVEKLHVSGSGEILGETGVDKILDKFNKSVDVNLHVVHADGGYRIYGKTPSMTPVKEFYQENKANVDAKLPGLEQAINDAIATIVDKVGKGESLKNTFKLETIWERMGWTEYEPGTKEATQVAFLQQVLANEENIWNFAYQTAMFYMEWVEGKQAFQEMQKKAPELMKYWNLAKKVRPNFMYYIVQKDGKVDVISQGNEAILNNDKSTVWALEKVSEFKVNLTTSVEKTAYPTTGGEAEPYTEYYGTLYTDFAYKLPEGVTAYKVTGINKVGDKAYVKKAELNSEVVPAQTPVLLIANTDELTLTIAEGGEAVADNQLYGNDYLINEYDINTPQLEGVFNLLAQLSQSTYDKYEYLMRKNAGTVNNKYFFGIAVEGELADAYKAKTGNEMKASPIRKLGLNTDEKVGFIKSWDYLAGNEGFMFSEEVSEILMNIVGDVNRDGTITISDVTALVNIILGKATYPADADKYDFEAADVNGDKVITISDVTALVNIILGK